MERYTKEIVAGADRIKGANSLCYNIPNENTRFIFQLKAMMPIITRASNKMVEYICAKIDRTNAENALTFDIQDVSSLLGENIAIIMVSISVDLSILSRRCRQLHLWSGVRSVH